jgi:hypothetical protein
MNLVVEEWVIGLGGGWVGVCGGGWMLVLGWVKRGLFGVFAAGKSGRVHRVRYESPILVARTHARHACNARTSSSSCRTAARRQRCAGSRGSGSRASSPVVVSLVVLVVLVREDGRGR